MSALFWVFLFELVAQLYAADFPASLAAGVLGAINETPADVVFVVNAQQWSAATPANLRCAGCHKEFTNNGNLANHIAHSLQCSAAQMPPIQFRSRKRRVAYTFREKRKVLLAVDHYRSQGHINAVKMVSEKEDIPVSDISKWGKDRARIFRLSITRHMGGRKRERYFTGKFHTQECALYLRFCWRREHLKLRVGRKWLRRQMKKLLDRDGIHNPRGLGDSWAGNFCKRWGITSQCKTNTKTTTIAERLPSIRNFHRWLIYGLQRSEPQRDPKYGRFPPHRMYHMDQVPLGFVPCGTKRTLNRKGARCQLANPAGTDSKRFCSLQVTICADPTNQIVPIEIIFGKNSGERLSEEEEQFYAALPRDHMRIRWQPKAWADEEIMIDYMLDFRKDTIAQGEVLLGMDNHGSQRTMVVETLNELLEVIPAYTPANSTDCTSPVDHHVGAKIKDLINDMFEEEYAQHYIDWNKSPKAGGLSLSAKRMLMVKWTSLAWTTIKRDYHELLKMAFVRTGFLVAKDGSENDQIKLWKDGLGQYTF